MDSCEQQGPDWHQQPPQLAEQGPDDTPHYQAPQPYYYGYPDGAVAWPGPTCGQQPLDHGYHPYYGYNYYPLWGHAPPQQPPPPPPHAAPFVRAAQSSADAPPPWPSLADEWRDYGSPLPLDQRGVAAPDTSCATDPSGDNTDSDGESDTRSDSDDGAPPRLPPQRHQGPMPSRKSGLINADKPEGLAGQRKETQQQPPAKPRKKSPWPEVFDLITGLYSSEAFVNGLNKLDSPRAHNVASTMVRNLLLSTLGHFVMSKFASMRRRKKKKKKKRGDACREGSGSARHPDGVRAPSADSDEEAMDEAD
ncbi:hypothetical protein EV182_006400, partial [Spiromyces aspiralis]